MCLFLIRKKYCPIIIPLVDLSSFTYRPIPCWWILRSFPCSLIKMVLPPSCVHLCKMICVFVCVQSWSCWINISCDHCFSPTLDGSGHFPLCLPNGRKVILIFNVCLLIINEAKHLGIYLLHILISWIMICLFPLSISLAVHLIVLWVLFTYYRYWPCFIYVADIVCHLLGICQQGPLLYVVLNFFVCSQFC